MTVHGELGAFGRVFDSVVDHILIHYRWVFVIFLLPISLLYDIWTYARSRIVFHLNSAPSRHSKRVNSVQKQVKEWCARGSQQQMCTARPGWQTMCFRTPLYKTTSFTVKVNLMDILEIDVNKGIVRVEPMVSMGQLTATLDPLGWTIPVLPEIDDLTVGGLVMGTGIETTSHKNGLFQHICVSYELVLADGSVVICSEENNPDLFHAVPWSYGTLGFLTAVEIKIIPALRFVKLEYKPVRSLDEAVSEFKRQTCLDNGNEFVEALMFSENHGVVMTGNTVSCAEPGRLNEVGRWYKPWFFEHVRSFLTSGAGVEYIPLRDYYHRHTRSLFWEMQDIIPFGNHLWFRILFGWMMPPKVSLLKLTQTKAVKRLYENNHIVQDMLVPLETLKDSIQMFGEEVGVYPLWLCPFYLPSQPGMLQVPQAGMYVDIGVYGVPKVSGFKPMETTRRIEAYVTKVKGFQMLYADTYMTRDEFRKMFNHELYDEMRGKLKCKKAFPEVYDKVSRKARD